MPPYTAARSLAATGVTPFERSAPAELALGTLVGPANVTSVSDADWETSEARRRRVGPSEDSPCLAQSQGDCAG
jgi:hypothetical protein